MAKRAERKARLVLSILGPLCLVSACNQGGSPACNITSDQQGSFMATVSGFPVPVSVDSSFSATQLAAIQYAASQWNAVGQQLAQTDFFEVQSGSNYQATPPDIGTCGANLSGGESTIYVVNEASQSAWSALQQSHTVPTASAVGVTFRCTVGNQAQRQVTVLDTSQIQDAQFSSVILHELGHGLGLDHSCNGAGGSASFVSCQGLPSDHPYVLAVMYPSLQMPSQNDAYVQVKDHIQSNDIDRTQCLYGSN